MTRLCDDAGLAACHRRMPRTDPALAAQELQHGLAHHRAGRLAPAHGHYLRATQLDPDNADAWHLLGLCALQANNPALATTHLRACVERAPGFAEAHNNLGVAWRRLGKHEESAAAFRAALGAREGYVEAAYNLGLSLQAGGHAHEAEQAYRQALAWRGDDFNSANNLGNLLREQGRFEAALPLLELAARLQPRSAQAHGNLAMLLIDLGRNDEAVRAAHTASALEPQHAAWWRALGIAERLRLNLDAAIVALRRALELDPHDGGTQAELGMALLETGDIDAARTILQACRTHPRYGERVRWAEALSLPSVYREEAQIDAERERFAHGLDALDAELSLKTAPECARAAAAASGVATFLLHYQDRDNTALQQRFGDLIGRVSAAHAPEFMRPLAWRARAHGARLRVGIVGSHFMRHTVSRYFNRLLSGLDPARFEVHVWYSGGVRDANTKALAAKVATFDSVAEDALATATKIRAAQLDALIYAETGMDPRHHMLGALRLAPVQCVLYGHPATSGLANMDYFLSGAALEPEDAQRHYRERLICLPDLGACPEPPPAPGDGSWLDRHAAGAPIALCLQNPIKLMPAFDAVLARIAERSGARIGFFLREGGVARRFRARLEAAFSQRGLDPATTLVFLPAMDYANYLGGVARAALVLDSPGFSGGATSLDALGLGTPVLTWNARMARGRQTLAMLRLIDIDGLVACDADDYVAKAVALLDDASARQALRERIARRSAILFDGVEVIDAFQQFLDRATREAAGAA
ncbi:MAG: tetratricopeptide repeat protein [Proteobacteria bacterium]|nr:tetratricopeptide repeat protein [Pseudomonadota bacterium]